jgi:GTPase SAR1 family protein
MCGVVQRLNSETYRRDVPAYIVNLDPAVVRTHYEADIDIRDTVNYKAVMKDYQLGPNGAIITALNLFSTNFHQVGVRVCATAACPLR